MGGYTSKEVLGIAVRMEDSARLFYEVVAEECTHKSVADLCRRLAWYEEAHFQRFLYMRDRLDGQELGDRLSGEEIAWLEGFMGRQVVPDRAEGEQLSRAPSPTPVLERAARAEREAIAFYRCLRSLVDPCDRASLDEIVHEEQTHLLAIETALAKVRAGLEVGREPDVMDL